MDTAHFFDNDGNPAGGITSGRGFTIAWQNGPLQVVNGSRAVPNGAFVEDIIKAAKDRLSFYQLSKFCCQHNEDAIKHLEEAIKALNARTKERTERGVEGTHQV